MTRPEAVEARRSGVRVEWWDTSRGGYRRGKVLSVGRDGTVARVIETGKTRSVKKRLEHLRLAEAQYEKGTP